MVDAPLPSSSSVFDVDNVEVVEISIKSGARRRLENDAPTDNDDDPPQPAQASRYGSNRRPTPPLGVRIRKGNSIIQLSNILTKDEINYV